MSWFSKLFGPKQEYGTEQRAVRAAESILGNETLTNDLDDEAASVLLDWALAWAERVAHSTSRLDDEAAQEAMYPRLKAIRKMMRSINRWGFSQTPPLCLHPLLPSQPLVRALVGGKYILQTQRWSMTPRI